MSPKPDDYIGKGSKYIAGEIDRLGWGPGTREFGVLQEFLRVELSRELVESQRKYQEDSVKQMRRLVYATWALVIATLLVVALTQYK